MKREVPMQQRCFFCAERYIIAVGGQRLCIKHKQIVEDIARDAGVPIHITVHRLTRDTPPEPRAPSPEHIGSIMPGVVAEIIANQQTPPAPRRAVPSPSRAS